jgi:hypothetical protein
MRRTALRLAIAVMLVSSGWIVGRAQSAGPDFVISVSAPTGRTDIRCVRGCRLAFIEGQTMLRNVKPETLTSFSFSCGLPDGCPSGQLGGWITP